VVINPPVAGRLSRRLVDPGNLVQADTTLLTTLVTLDPMYVYFDIDERTMLRLRRLLQEGKLKSRQEGAEYEIQVGLSDEEDFPHTGLINFSDNKLDVATGTLRVRGSIPNPPPRVLSPGMFARVRLPIGSSRKAILIPEQAVGTDQGRKYLYVITPQNEIDYRPIKVGPLERGMRVVDSGLNLGERVVVVGQQRVKPGAKVIAKPVGDPQAEPAPAAPAVASDGKGTSKKKSSGEISL
jgi:RND family efflux transporter MFP subunit